MLVCEICLILVLVFLGVYTSATDIRYGIIQNKVLIATLSIGMILDCIYYGIFAREFTVTFLINLLVISALAVALYAFHFWAAGDSKLLFGICLLFPARFYDAGDKTRISALLMILLIFLLAYLYVILDSVYQALKNTRFFGSGKISKNEVITFLKQYVMCFIYLNALSRICSHFLGQIYYENMLAFMFVNIFLAFVIQRKVLFRKWYALLIAVVVNIVLYQKGGTIKDNIRIYAILLVVLLLRYLVSGYNYAEIETNQVKAGMILSVATVLEFQKSRVKGLPGTTNEDMSTRLSEDEADAIRRWEQSKYGKEKIVIVRKIPFAIFITSGSVIFLLIRLFM